MFLLFRQTASSSSEQRDPHISYSLDTMTSYIKETLHELSHNQLTDLGLHEEEYRRRLNKRSELRRALKGCISGDVHDKRYVKEFISGLLRKSYGLNEQNIHFAIPFEDINALTDQDKFEIIFYIYQQQYQYDALTKLIDKYKLDQLKKSSPFEDQPSYVVTKEEIDHIFQKEYRPLQFEEKVQIVVQRIYQHYKGFSVVDDIRDQRIDGVSGGVNGIPGETAWSQGDLALYTKQMIHPDQLPARGCDSVWIFFKGKSIHLSFLSFGTDLELKRVCQNIYKYNHPGQLSEANGYKVNEMKDGSRVVVVRPPFAESWAFFVRKFDVPNASLEQLISDNNSELPIALLTFLMKGSRITAITGAQGSGKTTLLMAMVKHIYASYTLRVQEMAFELHLRNIYSRRNILSFRETENVTGQQGLDVQKKTDGTVNILGEVATDEVAAWMIQMSQVASLFTIFTHHAKTFRDLIHSLRNSLLKTGMFHDEMIAEQQVVNVINFDVHLKRDANGQRYIERITECIPRIEEQFTPFINQGGTLKQMMGQFMEVSSEFFRRSVHRSAFESRNIVEYRNGQYVAVNRISDGNVSQMAEQMTSDDARLFRQFVHKYWGETNEA